MKTVNFFLPEGVVYTKTKERDSFSALMLILWTSGDGEFLLRIESQLSSAPKILILL